ncbi:MAG: OmpA family protein [Pikeienuella sp.]
MRTLSLAIATTLALAVAPTGASAQSEDDLLKRFNTHTKTHRGLQLAPATTAGAAAVGREIATETPAQTESAPASTGATSVAAATETSSAAAPGVSQLYVRMPEGSEINILIQFNYDSAALRQSEFGKLDALCNAIRQSDIGLFRVFGHTDARGSDAYNLQLSQRRAESVRSHMVTACGIAPERLQAIGVGEYYPLVGSDPNSGENRRVEFQAIS